MAKDTQKIDYSKLTKKELISVLERTENMLKSMHKTYYKSSVDTKKKFPNRGYHDYDRGSSRAYGQSFKIIRESAHEKFENKNAKGYGYGIHR